MTSFENPGPSRRGDDPESVARRAGVPDKHPYEEPSHDPTTHEVSGRPGETPTVPVHEVPATGTPSTAARSAADTGGPGAAATPQLDPDPTRASRAAHAERTRARQEQVRPDPVMRDPAPQDPAHRAAAPPRRRRNWLLPLALAALAFVFMGLFASKEDSSDYAHSSMKVDETLPYPTEVRRTVNEAEIDAAEARAAAIREHDGTVVSESLETDNGYARWDVDILGEDGQVHSVVVDPGNGDILRDEVNTQVNMTDLRNAAASPTSAAAVADMVTDAGRTPTQIVYDAGDREWAATSWEGGDSIQENYSAMTGQLVPVAAER